MSAVLQLSSFSVLGLPRRAAYARARRERRQAQRRRLCARLAGSPAEWVPVADPLRHDAHSLPRRLVIVTLLIAGSILTHGGVLVSLSGFMCVMAVQ